jgi:hypothetical protein
MIQSFVNTNLSPSEAHLDIAQQMIEKTKQKTYIHTYFPITSIQTTNEQTETNMARLLTAKTTKQALNRFCLSIQFPTYVDNNIADTPWIN